MPRARERTATGNVSAETGSAPVTSQGPSGVAVDAAGGILVADALYRRIRRVGPHGRISTVAGSGVGAFGGDGGPAAAACLK